MSETSFPGDGPAGGAAGGAAGEESPREAMVRGHASAVFAVCLAHTRNWHDAEDQMQEVFVRAFAKLDSLRERDKARPWLLQIARRLCIDHGRRGKRAVSIPDGLAARAERVDPRVDRLQAALGQLPETYREAINLFYLDGRSCAGVAASLGISETAVRTRLFRGRLMLHDLLTRDGR